MNYWNVRKDGQLVLRPNVRPAGIYVSFDPLKRLFFRHEVHPMSRPASQDYWTPFSPDRIDPRAVAEATAYSIIKGRP
nr:hypothetical protein RNT25_01779 [arsenite-oxidising bacterium NT-25]